MDDWATLGFAEVEYQDLGHPEALEEALSGQQKVQVLKAKVALMTDPHKKAASTFGGECPCGCGTIWAGLETPLATGGVLHHTASQQGGHALSATSIDKHGVLHFKNSWGKPSECICVTAGPDMDGPDIDCPVHGIDAQVYSQSQEIDSWADPDSDPVGSILKAVEHYKGTSLKGASVTSEITGATPEQIALAFGVPVEVIAASTPVSTAPDVPPLFAKDDPEPVDTSSHRWCDACDTHWDFHPADLVACYSAGYDRESTVVEEKWRSAKILAGEKPT